MGIWQRRSGARSQGSINATVPASGTLGGDLQNTAPQDPQADTIGPVAGLSARTTASARARTRRGAKRLTRRSEQTKQVIARREQHHEARAHRLGKPGVIDELGEVVDHAGRRARIAFLGSWISTLVIAGVPMVMVLNDPAFVLSTMRRLLDIPDSTPIWAVWDPSVAVSLAVSAGTTLLLLATAFVAGKAAAHLLFRGAFMHGPANEEMRIAVKALPKRVAVVLLAAAAVVLGAMVVFLHGIAESRFSGGAVAAFQSDADRHASALVSWFITLLPVAVVVIEFLASHPTFEHARKTGRAAIRFDVAEAIDCLRDDAAARRQARALRRAATAEADLREMTLDVELRAKFEVVSAAIQTGRISAEAVGRTLGVRATEHPMGADGQTIEAGQPPTDAEGPQRRPRGIDVGSFAIAVVGARVDAAYRAFDEASKQTGSVREVWVQARTAAEAHRRRVQGEPITAPLHLVEAGDRTDAATGDQTEEAADPAA